MADRPSDHAAGHIENLRFPVQICVLADLGDTLTGHGLTIGSGIVDLSPAVRVHLPPEGGGLACGTDEPGSPGATGWTFAASGIRAPTGDQNMHRTRRVDGQWLNGTGMETGGGRRRSIRPPPHSSR